MQPGFLTRLVAVAASWPDAILAEYAARLRAAASLLEAILDERRAKRQQERQV